MMEGSGHPQWSGKRALIGLLLLLMCMTFPASTLQDSDDHKCPIGDYDNENGICCNKCPAGFKLVEKCHTVGHRSNCTTCPKGQYNDQINASPNCRPCKICKARNHEIEVTKCKRDQNAICRCEDGYYKDYIDTETYQCLKCTKCGPNEKEIQTCTENRGTVCGCKENYERVMGKCEQVSRNNTTPNPKATKGSGSKNENFVNLLAGPITVGLLLVIFIIYMAKKQLTMKSRRRETPLSQLSIVSTDSCQQALIHNNEPSKNSNVTSVAEVHLTEPEPSSLPDCVPLEIKMSEVIYTVLDVVPVPQVKQLVRSLGLKDTEIEQAEMDHRCCKEAHYQMLRVWAEKGSLAAGGGRGGMLHRPLLVELLDKLRQMHLGRAAEELETKYGIH
ncbi:tumor necrosis factor receptor superfamily member 1A isoform 1-T1 [Menidia menidia]